MQTIETERMLLKPPAENLAGPIANYYLKNREYFECFESSRSDTYYTKDYQKKVMQSEMANMNSGKSVYYYMSLKEKPDRIIGSMSFSNIRKMPYYSTIFGYDLHHDLWGRSLAYEACVSAIRSVFSEYNLHRIEARVSVDNMRSIRLLERLGFIKEGMEYKSILLSGDFRDHYRYAIFNEDFIL